ncbi:class I SAM-dependent methyltransferase [Alphaproteobacteria bacterium]|nr:class I SAM-dependent methyltransferase [Alphaproteobacteria bacterium]
MFVKLLDKIFYSQFKNNWDDKLFSDEIKTKLKTDSIILDLGAGAGIIHHLSFKGAVSAVHGIDLDPRVLSNPYLDKAVIGSVNNLPYKDKTFDVVFSNNVMEHLEFPETVLNEVQRVLKPGGKFLFKTTNKFHYVPLFAKLTPVWFHKLYNKLRGRHPEDTFPTLYKFNCKKDIQERSSKSNLNLKKISIFEGRPEYLRINFVTYILGIIYEKIVNSSIIFEKYRVVIIGEFKNEKNH